MTSLDEFYDRAMALFNSAKTGEIKNKNDVAIKKIVWCTATMKILYHGHTIFTLKRSLYNIDITYYADSCGWNTWSTARRINNMLNRLHDPMRFHRGGETVTTGYYKGNDLIVEGNVYKGENWDV